MNILYVEDCETTVALFQLDMDRHCGIDSLSLHVVCTVEEAIHTFNTEKHCAALIDWNLPDGDGIDVAQHIRNMSKTLPIMFLSSALLESQLQLAKKYDPHACLVKGYGKKYVHAIMEHLPLE